MRRMRCKMRCALLLDFHRFRDSVGETNPRAPPSGIGAVAELSVPTEPGQRRSNSAGIMRADLRNLEFQTFHRYLSDGDARTRIILLRRIALLGEPYGIFSSHTSAS